ncbi:MAG: hypothetical protein ACPLXP_03235, partial [Microgenomates group bacterium]
FLKKRIDFSLSDLAYFLLKIAFCAFSSGGVMFFFLKILDRSAWAKKLSFLGRLGLALPVTFDRFVLDTRYTVNLIYLTIIVSFIGLVTYLGLARVLKVPQLVIFAKLVARFRRPKISPPVTSE